MNKHRLKAATIGAVLSLATSAVSADGSPISEIPAREKGLVQQLRACIKAASSEGIGTISEFSVSCSQEKAALDAAVSNFSDQIIAITLKKPRTPNDRAGNTHEE